MKLLTSSIAVMGAAVPVGVSAQPVGRMDGSGGWMHGGTGGAEWVWIVVGILVAVLLVVLIMKQFNTKS